MKVIVYDSKPGEGVGQWFLWLSWAFWARVMKLFGRVDAVGGFDSWTAALAWLRTVKPVTELQYWGHGSSGTPWMAGKPLIYADLMGLKPFLGRFPLIWFRCCSTFRGLTGQRFAWLMATSLDAVVAGHTHIIGIRQSGLHTMYPGKQVDWPIDEGRVAAPFPYVKDLGHSVWCWQSTIPVGW